MITYAIGVCDEHRELHSLLTFLKRTKDERDDINVLVDSGKETPEVTRVLELFSDDISVNRRLFDGDFASHRNYHIEKCSGDYIFMIDADEIPQEDLIRSIRQPFEKTECDLVLVPRMNLCPGYTREWLKKYNFNANEVGFINWPDYQGRIFKNDPSIRWTKNLHEVVTGAKHVIRLDPMPSIGIWHIKSTERQEKQDDFYKNL
jgi:glycosyltransferase involved in cell wall biosynthesis|tara:strand:- start:711 stop:1322 length:612 start_codon:yes stop_codon:yes gene_type:complete